MLFISKPFVMAVKIKTNNSKRKAKGVTLLTKRGNPPRFTGRTVSGVFIAGGSTCTVTTLLVTVTALVVVSIGTV